MRALFVAALLWAVPDMVAGQPAGGPAGAEKQDPIVYVLRLYRGQSVVAFYGIQQSALRDDAREHDYVDETRYTFRPNHQWYGLAKEALSVMLSNNSPNPAMEELVRKVGPVKGVISYRWPQ